MGTVMTKDYIDKAVYTGFEEKPMRLEDVSRKSLKDL